MTTTLLSRIDAFSSASIKVRPDPCVFQINTTLYLDAFYIK